MRIVVTGGGGFIGSHIVEALVERGDEVIVVDDFSTGKRENLGELMAHINLIEGSITDLELVSNAMKGVDVVIHQAAIPSVPTSITDPLGTNEVNLTGTLNVLLAARDQSVRRVVYASSSAVYGDRGEAINHESDRVNPLSPYAVHKLVGEMYAGLFSDLYGVETIGLRYFNVFGPRQDPSSQYSGVISKFVQCLNEGIAPTVFGDGSQTRDFVYVKDVVQANLLAADSKIVKKAVYNVGTGAKITIKKLVATLNGLTEKPQEPNYGSERQGDIRYSCGAIERIRAELGYQSNYNLEAGLREVLHYFKQT